MTVSGFSPFLDSVLLFLGQCASRHSTIVRQKSGTALKGLLLLLLLSHISRVRLCVTP